MDNVSFGPHMFDIAVLLRESMLINGTMTNAEVWYNVTKSEIEEFENLDRLFFRRLLEVPATTPSEAYYLEFGILPPSVIIKARRINYLHNILKRDKTSMLFSFFITQWQAPIRGDWTEQVKQDLENLQIPCSFEYLQSKSKDGFKRIVKIKAKEYALKTLKRRQEMHRKMKSVIYTEMKSQSYLSSEKIKNDQKKIIFKYRTRMARFGENFRGGTEQKICPLCKLHLDNQEMSMQCPEIINKVEIKGKLEDLFKDEIKPEIIETITKITKIRKEIEEMG